jgi:hypothetical protein
MAYALIGEGAAGRGGVQVTRPSLTRGAQLLTSGSLWGRWWTRPATRAIPVRGSAAVAGVWWGGGGEMLCVSGRAAKQPESMAWVESVF